MRRTNRRTGGGVIMTLLGLGVMIMMFMIMIAILYNEDS